MKSYVKNLLKKRSTSIAGCLFSTNIPALKNKRAAPGPEAGNKPEFSLARAIKFFSALL